MKSESILFATLSESFRCFICIVKAKCSKLKSGTVIVLDFQFVEFYIVFSGLV